MLIHFTKMHGLGNDFVVINAINQNLKLTPEIVRALANRRLGVGCDQVLLVEAIDSPQADFRYRIFNADGNEVEHCGNGARCFARFVREEGLTDKQRIPVMTESGLIVLQVLDDQQVQVNMGPPRLEPADIPFIADHLSTSYSIEVDAKPVHISAVSIGNPHAVVRVDNVQTAEVARLGPLIESHVRFPNRVNVGFMQVIDAGHIRLRVYERGVGETLACGTGACAAVVAGRIQGLLDEQVCVDLPGGRLIISWPGDSAPVTMTGPATAVFKGSISL